jgi:hypothetical protein
MARLTIEVIAACFCFAFGGLGDASAVLARGLAIGFGVVDSDSGGLEKIVVFDIHSVGGDDVDGFLQAVWIACALDFANDFFVAQVLV